MVAQRYPIPEDWMSAPTVPTLQPHHNGYRSWTSYWRDDNGRARTKRFGKETEISRRVALALYRNWLNDEFPALAERLAVKYGVETLCAEYFAEIQKEYVGADGQYTGTVHRHKAALESFGSMYQGTEADDMTSGMVALWMVVYAGERRAYGKPVEHPKQKKVAATVNTALSYLKRMYRWAVLMGKVSHGTAGAVVLVPNMRAKSTDARQTDAIGPVALEDVERTQKKCGRILRDMIDVQWLSGMRPGEVCWMRPCDIEMSGAVWVYTPSRHKTQWRGRIRKIALGPKAQEIIRRYVTPQTTARLFQRGGKPYTAEQYRTDIRKAAALAGVEPFNPNQLRHAYATRVEKDFGAEAVRDILGHARLDEQRVYVQRSLDRAVEVAAKVG